MSVTDLQMKVLKIMNKKGKPMTPKEIGLAGKELDHDASSWACKYLKPLLNNKYVAKKSVKVEGTKRKRVEYRLLKKGEKAASA